MQENRCCSLHIKARMVRKCNKIPTYFQFKYRFPASEIIRNEKTTFLKKEKDEDLQAFRPRSSYPPPSLFAQSLYGTITTPILPACATTLLTKPSNATPCNRPSLCLIFAISYTCFRLTVPTVPVALLPLTSTFLPEPALPLAPSALLRGPGTLPAPRTLFPLDGLTPAAARSSVEVGGVRSSKWKERSGRTVTRAGIGVPGL